MVTRNEKRSGAAKESLGVKSGGWFGTLESAIDVLGKLAEVSAKRAERHGECTVKGLDKVRVVYGLNIRTGLDGEETHRVEPFGNVHAGYDGIIVDEVREPLVDVFDEGGEVVVTAELPGASKDEITVEQRGDILAIESHGERQYAKEIVLPSAIDGDSLKKKYNNGVLEIRVRKT